ncbi:WD domain, G-beta repeat-containing protein [Cryptosporidium felis]|nr:WD domain, G-beta repeat-containing protein [Cryptosporidium felis]
MLLSCGIAPDGGILDDITLVCCSSWDSISATGTSSGHVYLWHISKSNTEINEYNNKDLNPYCVLIPNSLSPCRLIGMVFVLSPSPLLQSCTDELLITLHSDNTLRYWSLDNGRCIAQLADSANHEVLQLVSLADKRFVLLVGHQKITIIDTWSRLNCGALKIASCPSEKRKVNNRMDEDTPDMYKLKSPCKAQSQAIGKSENSTNCLSNIYGQYGESMIFNVSTNHDYFELLKWSSNISLFDYCEDNRYPTAHFYTVAAILNTGQILVWDLSSLIRIWWHFIPIPHCEIPCPVPKPQKNSVPKPFMKYSQDEFTCGNSMKNNLHSASSSSDQILLDKSIPEVEIKSERVKLDNSIEDITESSLESYEHILERKSNASDNSKSSSFDNPNIYQLQSQKSPMLAPTFFSLHPCFVSEPINLYSIPSSEMFSTQIVVTDLYLIVNAKYRLIIWKRTFLSHFQNRTQRYQPFGDLFVPVTPIHQELDAKKLVLEVEESGCTKNNVLNESLKEFGDAQFLKRTFSMNINNPNKITENSRQKLQIWLGFSQASLDHKEIGITRAKTYSPIRTLESELDEKPKVYTSFLAWSSDFTIYCIKIPSVISFLFSQDFNPKFESNVAFTEHELTEIDSFGTYSDIVATAVFLSKDYLSINDQDQLNYLRHLASYWQFFKIKSLSCKEEEDLMRNCSPKKEENDHPNQYNEDIIWIHRTNFQLIQEKSNETLDSYSIEENSDKIFYAVITSNGTQWMIPTYYKFPSTQNVSLKDSKTSNIGPCEPEICETPDVKNSFFSVEFKPNFRTSNKKETNIELEPRILEEINWKSTQSLKSIWEKNLAEYDNKSDILVLACDITEQRNSIYCIISLSNGRVLGQCLTGEFGLFNLTRCNEDKHFFGNIESGVVYQLPLPRTSAKHKTTVMEIKSIADGCIFGLTCCGCIIVWKVDPVENCLQRINSGDNSNNETTTCKNKADSNLDVNKTEKKKTTPNNLFSLLLCIDGLFFTNILYLNKVIIFDINRLGELGTPKYSKFQILIHSSLERKCVLLNVNEKKEQEPITEETYKHTSGCIWDEQKNLTQAECKGVSCETLNLCLCEESGKDHISSRITSVAIDKPSNFIFIQERDIIFIFDRDSHLLLTKVSYNSILELKEYEFQNNHLSYGIISSLNRFIQTSNKIEFLDHGIMFGSLFIGCFNKTNDAITFDEGCLGVSPKMSISFMVLNPHVSADIVSIENEKQKNTKTFKYLQHLFPLFVRSTNEFLDRLFANMAPLSVRPILRFKTLVIGINYSISLPIYGKSNKYFSFTNSNSRSKLWDNIESYLNISNIKNSDKKKRSESVDRSRSIYSGQRESKIRSYTYDGTGRPPYRYVLSENWSENIMRHLDAKTVSARMIKSRFRQTYSRNAITNCPGRPFCEWNQLSSRRKHFGVDTNDYYIGELSGIPCTSHLVNRIVRSRNFGSNRRILKSSQLHQTFDETTKSPVFQRCETFDSRDLGDKGYINDFFETSRPFFRSRTYESALNYSSASTKGSSNFVDSDQIWLERFLTERSMNEKIFEEKLLNNNIYEEIKDSRKSCDYEMNKRSIVQEELNSTKHYSAKDAHDHFSAHQLALQVVILHYYFTYYSNLDLPIQLLDKFLLSWIIEHVEQESILVRFIPFHLFSITSMTLDIFNPYLRLSAKYCLQLAIRSLPNELLSYCEEIGIDTLSGIIREFQHISSPSLNYDNGGGSINLLEEEISTSNQNDTLNSVPSAFGNEIKSIPPWNESCRRGHPKNYSYCSISLFKMVGYRLPFPIMNSGEYYCSNLSIEDLSLFFLSIVLYEHPFKRNHRNCIGKIVLAFIISIITTFDVDIIIKFSKNFEKQQFEKKRLLKPIYARKHDNEQWYSWENLNIDSSKSNILKSLGSEKFGRLGGDKTSINQENLNYEANSYYNNISIMDTVRFLFALELFSLNFTTLLKSKHIENTCIQSLLRNGLKSWENNIYMAAHLFHSENTLNSSEKVQSNKCNRNVSSTVSNSIICLCVRLLTLAQYPPFWKSCRHLLQLIGQLDPQTYIYILGYSGRTAYQFMGINYTCNVLSLLVYFVSSFPEYSFPYLNMVVDISIGFLDPLDSTLRKGTISAVTSVLFILVSVFPMITFHQNTQRLAIGFDKSIIVYDLRTATKWRVLHGHTHSIDALCFNKEGEFLASYSIAERALRIWQCTQSGLLGGLLGISGSCIKNIELTEIPVRPLNCSLFYRLRVVKISCKNSDEWILRRENRKTYTITIEKK